MRFEAEIHSLVVHECVLQLAHRVEGARQRHTERHVPVVELCSGNFRGFGEVSVLDLPNYASEWTGGARQLLCEVIGPWVMREEQLSFGSLDWLVGNGASRFGVECALADLLAKQQGIGLSEFLGKLFLSSAYDAQRIISLGATVGAIGGWEDALREAKTFVARGAKRVKIKVARASLARAPWQEVSDLGIQVILDFNGSLRLDELPLLSQIPASIHVEEPVGNLQLSQYREVSSWANGAIFWDESAESRFRIEFLADVDSKFGAVVKPFRIGSLDGLNRLLEFLSDRKMPSYLGGMFETSIGRRMLLALGSHSCFDYPGDMGPSSWYYFRDVGNPLLISSGFSGLQANFGYGSDVEKLLGHECSSRCVTLERAG